MILLRLNDLGGLYCEISGGSKLKPYKYGESGAGWFPIESVNFGFKSQAESSVGSPTGNQASPQGRTGSSAAPSRVPTPTQTRGGTGSGGATKEGDEAFTTLSISRFVDGATTCLMGFAMADRVVTKSDTSKMRKADIHFLHSVMGDKTEAKERFIYPYLMITLASVLVKGWNISAQGDDRPTESLELWYDKAAMRYYRTVDGKVWNTTEPKGWDQYKNEEWVPSDGEAPFFKQPAY
jgi:type VI protein secretion system component Hcp